jgi:hypothetical protein
MTDTANESTALDEANAALKAAQDAQEAAAKATEAAGHTETSATPSEPAKEPEIAQANTEELARDPSPGEPKRATLGASGYGNAMDTMAGKVNDTRPKLREAKGA